MRMVAGDPGLSKYRVVLHEMADEANADNTILFDCDAEDGSHAVEQARDAYPQGEVIRAATYEEFGAHVIYCEAEAALCDGAGFWNNGDGWVGLDQATVFSADELSGNLPVGSYGSAPRWVSWKDAQAIVAEFILKSALEADLTACDVAELQEWIEDMQVSCPWHTDPQKGKQAAEALEGMRAEMNSRREQDGKGVER